MSCLALHSNVLRQRGFRMTPQRLSILEALHHDGHLSPAQVYARVRQTGMTEATVYRTLEFLTENNVIFAAHNSNGHLTYELAGHDHHHLICRSCGAQVGIEHDALNGVIGQLEQQTGYRLNTGHLTLFGLCPSCQNLSPTEVVK